MHLNFDHQFNKAVIGIDEVGRGSLIGEVTAAAICIRDKSLLPSGIKDSKKLSELKRKQLYVKLVECVDYGIGSASVKEIDELNILNATKLAMYRAYNNLKVYGDIVLIDGRDVIEISEDVNVYNVIRGDNLSLSIAIASIIAKVTRDNIICKLHEKYPVYNWHKNKGYATREHKNMINKHGITEEHRKSFTKWVHCQLHEM